MTSQDVWEKLQKRGEIPASISGLLELYRDDPECFFSLACDGVPRQSAAWGKKLAQAAKKLRELVLRGFEIVPSSDPDRMEVRSGREALAFPRSDANDVFHFLNALNGTGAGSAVRKNFNGIGVTEAEVAFSIGKKGRSAQARVAERMKAAPVLLQLDTEERKAVTGGMPAYVAHELASCATKVVQAPTAVFEGLRDEGSLKQGRAYTGRPKWAYDNAGRRIPHPAGMVYVVYADRANFVFDWDWVKEDPHHPGRPVGWASRFTRPLDLPQEAALVGVEDLAPNPFRPKTWWRSSRGDCAFFYISDEHAYAERVNDDLTAFRSFATGELVGCKVKNFRRLELKAQLKAQLEGKLARILTVSLLRQTDHGAYGTLIPHAFEAEYA